MADWIQTHSFISCENHETAVQIYQRLEVRSTEFDGGLRWGFWDAKTLLVCATMRYRWNHLFVDELIEDFNVESVHEAEDGEGIYEKRVREILGVKRSFLWSNNQEILAQLLANFEPYDTGLTALALCESYALPVALSESIEAEEGRIIRGFLTEDNRAFVLGYLYKRSTCEFSPLENPLIAPRLAGSSWSITNALDGETLLPPNPFPIETLWKMERHGGLGFFQPLQQRTALIHEALESEELIEQQAGCAMARRWNMDTFTSRISELVTGVPTLKESAEAALLGFLKAETPVTNRNPSSETKIGEQMIEWLDLEKIRSGEEIKTARTLLKDETFGSAVRWMLVSQPEVPNEDLKKIINASVELFEISSVFLSKIEDENHAIAFVQRAAEIAYSITRTAYFQIRYGIKSSDYIQPIESSWNGETTSKASRINYWASQIMGLRDENRHPRHQAIRAFVAMNELLFACRDNRVFWIPNIGIIHGLFLQTLKNEPAAKPFLWTPESWISFEKQTQHLVQLFREANEPEKRAEIRHVSTDILDPISDLRNIWQYSSLARGGIQLLAWVANNLAWILYEDGEFESALGYAEIACQGANWEMDPYRDTLALILIALDRKDDAFQIAYAAIGRGSSAFDSLSENPDYQEWRGRLEVE